MRLRRVLFPGVVVVLLVGAGLTVVPVGVGAGVAGAQVVDPVPVSVGAVLPGEVSPPEPPPVARPLAPVGERRGSSFDARRSVEVSGERDAFSKVFRNVDGSFTRFESAEPVHYRDAQGGWAPIDTRVVKQADGLVRNTAGAFTVMFGVLNALGAVSVVTADGSFSWRGVDANAVAPVIEPDGVSVRYVEAWPGVDVVYRVRPAGVDEIVELKGRGSPAQVVWETDGIRFERADTMFEATGVFAGKVTMPFPETFDSQGRVVDGEARSALAAVPVDSPRGGGSRITLGVDAGWAGSRCGSIRRSRWAPP